MADRSSETKHTPNTAESILGIHSYTTTIRRDGKKVTGRGLTPEEAEAAASEKAEDEGW